MITESTHMAKLIILIVATQILLHVTFVYGEGFVKTINRKQLNLHEEKLTHFRVYWHDVASGPNPSFATIRSPLSNSSLFGMVNIIDDPLTTEASINSAVVGRAQGMYAGTAQKEVGLLMVMNFAFTSGKYNGSTISILGRNALSSTVREMPVIGGSGMFRFARGYVEARTKMFNPKTGDSSVEYSCYVLHY